MQSLAAAGELSGITLVLFSNAVVCTEAQLTADAGALGKITNAVFGVSVTGVPVADIAKVLAAPVLASPHVASLQVSDTAANVAANLDELQTLVASGTLLSIVLTDGGTPTLTITANQQLNDAGALGIISSPHQLLVVPSASAQESNSGLTNNPTDTITVTASAAIGNSIARVAIYDGSTFLANATASGLATWSYTATKLSNGDHAFHAVVTDSAGNTTTTAPLPTLTVDAAPPKTTISETVTLSSATTSPSVKVSGVASDSSGVASVYMNGGSTNLLGAGGTWSYMQNNLANGVHQYVATIADALGNTTTATGSTIQVNSNSNVALKGTVGGDAIFC